MAPVVLRVSTPEQMVELGRRLGRVLAAGDLVLLSGELGAGKTTLARGLGDGLGVRGPVTSPTFVLARVHPSLTGGPRLVHVDAYRLGGLDEVDDLDLDADLDASVVVAEWGEGKVEHLSEDRIEVHISRAAAAPAPAGEDARSVVIDPIGSRWAGVELAVVLGPLPAS